MGNIKDGMIYIVLPGDPLRNFMIAHHFFIDDFEVLEGDVLVRVGQLFDSHIELQSGEYQTYLVNDNIFSPMVPLKVSKKSNIYRLSSGESWCTKKIGSDLAYFPDENSRILFEKYFGIR